MKQAIQNYIQDESAVDEAVGKIIFIVIAITCAMGIGWWIWNTLEKRTNASNCANSNSPFCVE